ncbi:MAG: type 1 periplasmic binding fold superfamily protein [Cytophagia bacterium]|nr:MAG: type 1 periplasmic binding fold superfamily protein [Cytophagales bacterium]TAG07520.1 MAG: type 1 periplasmic binding fold superfamily protein [Cytophagia bacterium]TAG44632.1 MAG: type 1 periplasmic binding fold superfamily protein [Cytophagia bacterium]
MKNFLRNSLLVALVTINIIACKKKEDPKPVEENELITTVKLTFTRLDANNVPVTNQTPIVVTWKDMDGTGSGAPVLSGSVNLMSNTSYNISTEFLDETKNPAENITTEISAEKEAHQVFFIRSTTTIFSTFSYLDFDANTKPVGLQTRITTASTASNGTLRVVLRHEPNKNGVGVSGGDITNAGGSTDVDTTPAFTVNITVPQP